MSAIATLTLNPAVDVSLAVESLEPDVKLRCEGGDRDPGGGGINVARVIRRLGGDPVAVFPVGGPTGEVLHRLVAAEGVPSALTPIAGECRENITVLEARTGAQYRFVLPGPHMHDLEWMACLKTLAELPVRPSVVCASGSLPPGAPKDFYARVGAIAEGWCARFVLDASGPPLRAALDTHLHLIKPNLAELRELTGVTQQDTPSLAAACRALIARHRIEAVALTLGANGALLVTAENAWRARPLSVNAISSVGAGDSFLAAMIWAQASGKPLLDAFRYGMAAGAAAVQRAGTELAGAAETHRLAARVEVEAIALHPAA